jgi:hypothetical protein
VRSTGKFVNTRPEEGHVTTLAQRKQRLIRACEIANRDFEVREIEEEFDALADEIAEPWEVAPEK